MYDLFCFLCEIISKVLEWREAFSKFSINFFLSEIFGWKTSSLKCIRLPQHVCLCFTAERNSNGLCEDIDDSDAQCVSSSQI